MASKKKKQPGIVRCFEVSDPSLHLKGHTIYKVTQRVIQIDCPEEDIKEVVVWRRYNEFKKLYAAMSKLHQALHRQDEFPPFVEGKVFGRFDQEVITRRMLCGQDLLNFIGQRNYLVASRAFQQFFEGGEIHKFEGPPVLLPPALDPKQLIDDLDVDDFPPEDRPRPDGDDMPDSLGLGDGEGDGGLAPEARGRLVKVPSYNQLLGGVWRYRQIAEEISLGGDEDDQTDFTDDSALSTPLPEGELSFFDPLQPGDDENDGPSNEMECSNEWLLCQVRTHDTTDASAGGMGSEEAELKKLEEEFTAYGIGGTSALTVSERDSQASSATGSPLTGSIDFLDQASRLDTQSSVDLLSTFVPTPQSPHDGTTTTSSDPTNASTLKAKSGSIVERGKGDLVWSPVHKPTIPTNLTAPRPLHSLGSTPSSSPVHSASSSTKGSPSRSPLHHGLVNIDVKDKADYIFLAANQISLAQQCEANNNYHMAFSYYKSAVGIMLTGVQLDANKTRREVVRKKTAKYLLKAEELYHQYLDSCERSQESQRWDTGKPSPAKELDPNVAFMQGSVSELKSFKVLGVIDKVLLVIDSLSDHTFVFKVLHKSCSDSSSRRNIIPVHLPYMVQLHKFYETDSAIYLLLQHASGGKLWTYVSGYLQQQYNDADLENILNDPHEKWLRNRASTGDSQATLQGSEGGASRPVASVLKKPDTPCLDKCNGLSNDVDSDLVTINQNGVHYSNINESESKSGDTGQIPSDILAPDKKQTDNLASEAIVPTATSNKDEDGLSLEESQPSSLCQKGHTKNPRRTPLRSISTEVKENTDSMNGSLDTGTHFEDILKVTIVKPSMDHFSIDSFDSDSAPGSRYESVTSDFIESIPELSEVTPQNSPHVLRKISAPSTPGDVFPTGSNANTLSLNAARDNTVLSSERVIGSAMNVIKTADAELSDDISSQNDRTRKPSGVHDFDDLDLTTPVATVTSQEPDKSSLNEECSIYDVYKPVGGESEVNSDIDVAATIKENSKSTSDKTEKTKACDIRVSPSRTDPKIHSPVMSPSRSLDSHAQLSVFRLPSQERSADVDGKPKKRHRSGLIGSFNMDEDELKAGVRLPEGCVRQWAAEILTAIASLHSMSIICRDLQPKNVLLGDQGHILLTYISQWNCVDSEPCTEPHEMLYSAPEVGGVSKVTAACDWWSFGAILFELLTGKTVASCHPSGVTSHTHISVPGALSTEAQALLRDLLKFHPEERLGARSGGAEDIKMHPFFQGVDWNQLQSGAT